MKKKLTIPLLVAALVLWGVILYRVLAGGGETVGSAATLQPQPQKAAVVAKPKADSLLLNYPDPFLEEVEVEPLGVEPVEAYDTYEEEVPYIDWSQVQYLGSVTGGEVVALVMINGQEYMLKAGDTVAGYTLVGQIGNSIAVRYEGQVGSITMQGNNE
ncbi:hypothetical protein [Parapedobacter sp. 10938]|uniref:hypothetical protein n=1 Tax=Parapedobacter flavus TaxID=3110225 RepID=UPI002DBBF6D2|nr:hypothetical protein [Parapedobacter sp. 10938]MEC3882036.1 hypothetical protein [Parapedobacter sp. 10938]